MTTEPTLPQPELGPAQANGQGQSQGHRRRRRRRKNKSSQPGGAAGAAGQIRSRRPAAADAGSAAAASAGRAAQAGFARIREGRRRNSSRKRFGAPQPQPGNSISFPDNGRRKDKQKGPRMFVGPMDHSYRIVNGNVADGPPSTIPTSSNGHHGGYYPDVNMGAPSVSRCARCAHAHLLLHRGPVLPGQDPGDGAQARHKSGICEGREGNDRAPDRCARGRAADAGGFRSEQSECQTDDTDSEIQRRSSRRLRRLSVF